MIPSHKPEASITLPLPANEVFPNQYGETTTLFWMVMEKARIERDGSRARIQESILFGQSHVELWVAIKRRW